jgi:6-pyruvoyltetrahydropterin/6-carboxytetrahydropterin synthase
MYRISKVFEFSASHRLYGLPETHQCARLHGHNYIVEVALSAEWTNPTGFVRDYGELKPFKDYIDTYVDHRDLNQVLGPLLPGGQTSAENLAKHFYDWCRELWPEVVAVTVKETPKTAATYEP